MVKSDKFYCKIIKYNLLNIFIKFQIFKSVIINLNIITIWNINGIK